MLIVLLFVILGIGFLIAISKEKLNIFYLSKICTYFYFVRICFFIPIAILFSFVFKDFLVEISNNANSIFYFGLSIAIYGILYFFHRKIIFTSLLRTSEITARFTLDLLPGEQLAIDIAKRDGLFSVVEADNNRRALSSSAISVGSLESKVRLLGSESLALLFMVVLSNFVCTLIFRLEVDLVSQILKYGLLSVNIGSCMMLSSCLTFSSFFSALSNLETNKKSSFNINKIAVSTFKVAFILSCISMILDLVVFKGSTIVKGVLFDLILTIAIFSSYLFFKMKKVAALESATLVFFPFENIEKDREFKNNVLLQKQDLVISLNFNSNDLAEEVSKKIYETISKFESLMLPVQRVILKNYSKDENSNDNLHFQWRSFSKSLKLDFEDNDFEQRVLEEFREFFDPICRQDFLISDLSRIYNLFFIQEKNAFYKALDFTSLRFIKKAIDFALKYNINIVSLKLFTEFCLSHIEDEDIEQVFKDLFESHPESLAGKDGISRVVYLDGEMKEESSNYINQISNKLKVRGLSPLIVLTGLEASSFEYIENCIFLNTDLVPKNIKFFPIAKI